MPESVSLFDGYFLILLTLALAFVVAILFTAPSLSAGTARLKLIHNVLGIVIVGGLAVFGATLLVWGLVTGSKELIYLAILPLMAAGFAYNGITRHHRTWYGALGFDDRGERWRSYWNETISLWRSVIGTAKTPTGESVGSSASPGMARADRQSSPRGGRTHPMISLALDVAKRRGGLASAIATVAAQQIEPRRISVTPALLDLSIALRGKRGEGPSFTAVPQPELTVRRADGGLLQLTARTDLPFLKLTIGPRQVDGTYRIKIELLPHSLSPGRFIGAIEIETDDPVESRLTAAAAACDT
jgi:hypothetical protein